MEDEINKQTAVKNLYVYKTKTKLVGIYSHFKEDIVSNFLFWHEQKHYVAF